MDCVLTFGKYKGQMLRDVLETNASYVRWLCSIGNPAAISALASLDPVTYKKTGPLSGRVKVLCACFPHAIPPAPVPIETKMLPVHPHHWKGVSIEQSSACGVFVDYLVRWILSTQRGCYRFHDHRADFVLGGFRLYERIEDYKDDAEMYEMLVKQKERDGQYALLMKYGLTATTYDACGGRSAAEILRSVRDCSAFHRVSFTEDPWYTFQIKTDNEESIAFYNDLAQYLKEVCPLNKRVELNVACGADGIGADCDLIIGDTLVELTCSAVVSDYVWAQCLGYVSFMRNRALKFIEIWNFSNGVRTRYDIRNVGDDEKERWRRLIAA